MAKKARRRVARAVAPPANPVHAFVQNFSWKWFIVVVGGFGTVLGAIVAYDKAHPIIEPWTPATSGYVRDYANETATKKVDPITNRMNDYEAFRIEQTMEITKLNLNTLNQNLLLAKKEIETNPTSQVVRDAVATLTKQVADTRRRIEEYEAALFARRAGK